MLEEPWIGLRNHGAEGGFLYFMQKTRFKNMHLVPIILVYSAYRLMVACAFGCAVVKIASSCPGRK